MQPFFHYLSNYPIKNLKITRYILFEMAFLSRRHEATCHEPFRIVICIVSSVFFLSFDRNMKKLTWHIVKLAVRTCLEFLTLSLLNFVSSYSFIFEIVRVNQTLR